MKNLTPAMKKLLIVEVIVGIVIMIGGIYVLASGPGMPVLRSSPSPLPYLTYVSSPLQITLQYPSSWTIDTTYNGIPGLERFQGFDGFFRVEATNDPTKKSDRIIKKYPVPIILGETKYRYFVLYADPAHLQSIANTVEFMNK